MFFSVLFGFVYQWPLYFLEEAIIPAHVRSFSSVQSDQDKDWKKDEELKEMTGVNENFVLSSKL